jgi:hypothetical protein
VRKHTGRPEPVNHTYWPTDLVHIFPHPPDPPSSALRAPQEDIMARHHPGEARALPHALVRLIHAAKDSGSRDQARALRQLGQLALKTIPTHGIFVANENDIGMAVERIARAHLGLGRARQEFRDATRVVESFHQRDPIESAHNHIESIKDEAYFLAGLAFGLTLLDYSCRNTGTPPTERRLLFGAGNTKDRFHRAKGRRTR